MENITNADLKVLKIEIINEFRRIVTEEIFRHSSAENEFEWLRSKSIRKIMNIAPATLQNLRISEKIRFKKVMGSYYYNKKDLYKLFEPE
ncbi:DNA-binding protein [Chryseobacterium sp. Ch-15]|uniref:DNA-binding protein n=1 Tax=Chryseobacterium muglaense TaxID=2893752 RepID=A0A9Q3YPI6_9FLAO|nr:DNA-binding protein [Chryseobacterium muglaense]MBD3903869.1 DNA-binding protein [Chryseobacterium muglaense]MCC9032946.1 DNA-binding protein [Chryseobacterium muglaense]MCM2553517.1 DNA-binding protein [Chryseobacterium muglaense]